MSTTKLIDVTVGQIDGHATRLADARLLHEFLEVGKDFTTWIKLRIRQYGFEQNRDYLLTQTGEQVPHQGGLRSVDRTLYLLTLDMAKELAMVERTPKGREARRYFIDCERQVQALREQGLGTVPGTLHANYPMAIDLIHAHINTINRQAWADVAGENAARFHARREALLQQQRQLRNHAAYQAFFERNRPAWAR
jgi:phage anti-repressor protein